MTPNQHLTLNLHRPKERFPTRFSRLEICHGTYKTGAPHSEPSWPLEDGSSLRKSHHQLESDT